MLRWFWPCSGAVERNHFKIGAVELNAVDALAYALQDSENTCKMADLSEPDRERYFERAREIVRWLAFHGAAITAFHRCPYSDGNACEQYRLQGQRCQDCPLLNT